MNAPASTDSLLQSGWRESTREINGLNLHVVIAVAVAEAALRTVGLLFHHARPADADASHEAKEEVRLRLGRWLALACELDLGADILRTAVAPT